MKKLALLAILSLLLVGCISQAQEKEINSTASATANSAAGAAAQAFFPKACFENGKCVSLEVADSPEERAVGLMNRSFLPPYAGMLFVFGESDRHYFWMKNTPLPLDVVWLNEQKQIVDIQQMVPCNADPCKLYEPKASAKYALEVNAGVAEENSLGIGQKISFELTG